MTTSKRRSRAATKTRTAAADIRRDIARGMIVPIPKPRAARLDGARGARRAPAPPPPPVTPNAAPGAWGVYCYTHVDGTLGMVTLANTARFMHADPGAATHTPDANPGDRVMLAMLENFALPNAAASVEALMSAASWLERELVARLPAATPDRATDADRTRAIVQERALAGLRAGVEALDGLRRASMDIMVLRLRAGIRAENWSAWLRALDADPDTVFVWCDVPDAAGDTRTREECAPEREALARKLREGLAANRRARGLALAGDAAVARDLAAAPAAKTPAP